MVHQVARPTVVSKRDRSVDALAKGADPLRVYVAEQNHLAAQYLLQILSEDRRLRAFSVEDLVRNGPPTRIPLVFVADRGGIDLPLGECVHVLRMHCAEAKFVVLDRDGLTEDEIVQLLTLGIHGFVAYSQVRDHLRQAVHSVAESKLWVPTTILEAYVRHSISLTKNGNFSPPGQAITKRESQIIELVKRRLSNREIGAI